MSPGEKLLRELIALPSVNPAFIGENDPRAGEQRVADFLTATAARAGFDVEQREVSPRRNNVLIRLAPSGKTKSRVILAPHTDTVGHADMPATLFDPVKTGDRLFGRGSCDTKGSIAAMFTALARVLTARQRPAETEIVLAALVDEESGQTGSRALARQLSGDLAIVGEPTRLQVITAHKGDVWLTLRTRGRAAHSSRPELGRNAIHEMARAVDLLETRYAAQLARRRHAVLGPPTVNVGMIHGGTQPNIVPDFCEISVDRRTIPGETTAGVRREIAALLSANKINAEIRDTKASLECWPMETDNELPLVQAMMAAARQRETRGVHYFSDAAIFAHAGTPAVLFGPGDIAQAHTADEWISLRSLERATDILAKFLSALP